MRPFFYSKKSSPTPRNFQRCDCDRENDFAALLKKTLGQVRNDVGPSSRAPTRDLAIAIAGQGVLGVGAVGRDDGIVVAHEHLAEKPPSD